MFYLLKFNKKYLVVVRIKLEILGLFVLLNIGLIIRVITNKCKDNKDNKDKGNSKYMNSNNSNNMQ